MKTTLKKNPIISLIMGSDSDYPIMKPAQQLIEEFNIPYETKIVSAHRTPKMMQKYSLDLKKRGIKIIIAGAGGAAHLPGMVASLTPLPVIGVPILTQPLAGLDSVLSIVQMPRGVPVATVGVNNSYNAVLLAIRILALLKPSLDKKLKAYILKQSQKSKTKKLNV